MYCLKRVLNRNKNLDAPDINQTKAFRTELVDFAQSPPRLRPLGDEELEEFGSSRLPKKTSLAGFFGLSALLLLALAQFDTLFIELAQSTGSSFTAKEYFASYTNPLNFSVFLAVASSFALIYGIASVTSAAVRDTGSSDTDSNRPGPSENRYNKIFAVTKGLINVWPLIVAAGLAFEIQSFFGFHFPFYRHSLDQNLAWMSVARIYVPQPANGWFPEAAATPFFFSCGLFVASYFVYHIIEEGRFIPDTEVELLKRLFRSKASKSREQANLLFDGAAAKIDLPTAAKYLGKTYASAQVSSFYTASAGALLKDLALVLLAAASFVFYFRAYTGMLSTNNELAFEPARFVTAVLAISVLGIHALRKVRLIRIQLAFRHLGFPIGGILYEAAQSLFFLLTLPVLFLSVGTLFGQFSSGHSESVMSTGVKLFLLIHAAFVLVVVLALFVRPEKHRFVRANAARIYLYYLRKNIEEWLASKKKLASLNWQTRKAECSEET